MKSPKLYLAMDNCFAVKRWITPSQWMRVIKDLGAVSIEASTDNEIDPLFCPADYRSDWVEEVKRCEESLGMKVKSFFTGYQTYRTAGLAHPDERMRNKVKNEWFKPLIEHAEQLGSASIGFSFHALQEAFLTEPESFRAASKMICDEYRELAEYARAHGGVKLCCEQMYAPYQSPWTVKGSRELMSDVYSGGQAPFYIAIDVGHMVGQRRFLFPDGRSICELIGRMREGLKRPDIWLGPDGAYKMLQEYLLTEKKDDAAFAERLIEYIKMYPYMFAEERESDPYYWIEELGAYSPIIHMQQTDGIRSSHAPFTEETGERGIIKGRRLLEALAESYSRPADPSLPPRTDEIVLAFEIFISNIKYPQNALDELKETVEYWKKFIPEDGITLDDALKRLN